MLLEARIHHRFPGFALDLENFLGARRAVARV